LVRSPLALRCSREQNALHTLIHQRHLTPSCRGQAPYCGENPGPGKDVHCGENPGPGKDVHCGENPGPGKDVHGELEPRPGIREQPGSKSPSLRLSIRLPLSGDCVAKLSCSFERVRLIQDQASMRNVDSRIHSLRFNCCVFLFYSFSTVTSATQSGESDRKFFEIGNVGDQRPSPDLSLQTGTSNHAL
jgi:hypothetical protein